jgi:periplasmic divalent cation tolerance protein
MGSGGRLARIREPDMADIRVLYTTWPDAETAEQAGAEAVAERLAACVNIFAPIRSVYRWKGAVERAGEVPMTLKTTAEASEALCAFHASRHPYETPCIIALPALREGSHGEFLAWIEDEVAAPVLDTVEDEPVTRED